MVVFSIFFGRLAGIPSDGVPYPIFAYTALVPWTFFANALSQASNSLLEQERLITKIYFPRLLLPLAAVLSGLLDFAISFLILIGMIVWYGLTPTPSILLVPFFVLMATLTAFGGGLWLSALNVQYRDVRYVIPFLVQFWLFVSPIAYPSSLVPEPWRVFYGLNPMAGVVEGFRWALLGNPYGSAWCIVVRCFGRACGWAVLFPPHGRKLCGCDLAYEQRCHSCRKPEQALPHRRTGAIPGSARCPERLGICLLAFPARFEAA
jgi:lipopolysaccharide transport system permease protein